MSPDQQTTIKYYCFVHAIEGGLLQGPLAQLPAVATNTGYSKNAVVFVIEALSQRECLTEVDGQRPMWSITAPTKTADQFCIAIRLGTIEHFDFHEHLVLKHWKLIRGADIGLILSRLAAADVLGLEGARAAQVVEDLRATQRELLTFPYGEY